ncbi:MAG: hypothetical protein Q8N18_26170 [Opitutaceae bacterium]|nr:hypothetical protein [Opitutaceae bacterium]
MKTLSLVLAVTLLSGCVLVNNPPARLAGAKLERASSPSVDVARPFFEHRDGHAYLVGYVERAVGGVTTARTNIHIAFFDARGTLLKESTVGFTPADLPASSRKPGPHAKFELLVDDAPADVARI